MKKGALDKPIEKIVNERNLVREGVWDEYTGKIVKERNLVAGVKDAAEWYFVCLDDIANGRACATLSEAKAGYESAVKALKDYKEES